MKFFTSRYTQSLEEQVADLKKQLDTERAERRALLDKLMLIERGPNVNAAKGKCCAGEVNPRTGRFIHEVGCKEDPKAIPQAGNWLRTRGRLEDRNLIVREAPLEEN